MKLERLARRQTLLHLFSAMFNTLIMTYAFVAFGVTGKDNESELAVGILSAVIACTQYILTLLIPRLGDNRPRKVAAITSIDITFGITALCFGLWAVWLAVMGFQVGETRRFKLISGPVSFVNALALLYIAKGALGLKNTPVVPQSNIEANFDHEDTNERHEIEDGSMQKAKDSNTRMSWSDKSSDTVQVIADNLSRSEGIAREANDEIQKI